MKAKMLVSKAIKLFTWFSLIFINLVFDTPGFSQENDGINGKFFNNGIWNDTVYLCQIKKIGDFFSGSDFLVIDTCPIAEDGSFHFSTANFPDQKMFYRVNFTRKGQNPGNITVGYDKENYIFLLLDKNSQTRLNVFGQNIPQLYEIEGEQQNKAIKVLTKLLAERQRMGTEIYNAMENARLFQPAIPDSLMTWGMEKASKQYEIDRSILKAFAEGIKYPELALLAACYMEFPHDLKNDLIWYEKLSKRLLIELADSDYTKQFARETEEYKAVLPVGTTAPEITLPGIGGDTIRLSDIKSKLVLVDFWASWCTPCRHENRETVLPLYRSYHPQGFEVFGVSLDTNREKWLNAIVADQLPWIHVSDLKGFHDCPAAQAYNIEAVPATYLLDENWNILAKNLRGFELMMFVKNHFGK